jgi:hypothetical protein
MSFLKKWSDRRTAREAEALAEKYRQEVSPPPSEVTVTGEFGYIHYKAFRYLTVGAAKYRRSDFFHLPPRDWSSAKFEAVRRGCEQIVRWRGMTPESALEGIGIEGFYALLQLFHFELKQQSLLPGDEETFMDKMEMRHVVSSHEITLYNKVRGEKKAMQHSRN